PRTSQCARPDRATALGACRMMLKIDDIIADGASRADIEALPVVGFTPQMAPEAYYGLAGRIVRAIEPHSEADPVAILMNVLLAIANAVGRGPHALVEKTQHTCGEFAVWSARQRKAGRASHGRCPATSWNRPTRTGRRGYGPGCPVERDSSTTSATRGG